MITHKQLAILLFLFVTVIFYGCKEEVYHPVKYKQYRNIRLEKSEVGFFVDSIFDKSKKVYQYYDNDTDLIYRFDIEFGADTNVLLYFEQLQKIEEKIFIVNDEPFKILKYNYDIPKLIDEESFIFFNENYELICINNTPWLSSEFVENERIPESLQTLLLKEENKLFFDYPSGIDSL